MYRGGKLLLSNRNLGNILTRASRGACNDVSGIVVGAYTKNENSVELLADGACINEETNGSLMKQLTIGHAIKQNETRIFWNLHEKYPAICVVGLGQQDKKDPFAHLEAINSEKENIRNAAAVGCQALTNHGIMNIKCGNLNDYEAAAEGAILSSWVYQEFKNAADLKKLPTLTIDSSPENQNSFKRGVIKANAQNFARMLMETPANHLTPTIFASKVINELSPLGISVTGHDQSWIAEQKMNSFLSVTQGSAQPPIFLELNYSKNSNSSKCFALVGKGVTFDSGGISIKPSAKMDEMRADMGGAACVVATMKAIAEMNVNVNVKAFIPLCENLPSATATKPGDVFIAKNGKSIAVDNTDAEGRLILADALCYASEQCPEWIVDVATLTGAMGIAVGDGATGVFSNCDNLWKELHEASIITGDRVWRFPLWRHYKDFLTKKSSYDLNNIGIGTKGGGACVAAAFLREFVPENIKWMHLDIAGVMSGSCGKYLKDGMSGRPTRTLIQFIEQISQKC
ncbi:cytosol aminopeptidase-like [Chrysoperla carnea]|uniref:cytosol aminopeptidase-like n=1 Tax=Chrysoperla carnea TaxID=189513 RepID=UPI001D07F4F4|nr:cytosol aminopeptidase-like [Chrysoperla carnea]